MRNYITRISPSEVHINALFLQPTTYCSYDCTGCYVKAWEQKNNGATTFDPYSFKLLLDEIIEGKKISLNQVTLALDTKPKNGTARKSLMHDYFEHFLEAAREAKKRQIDTEFHITTHNYETLLQYTGQSIPYTDLGAIDVISFSSNVRDCFMHALNSRYSNTHFNFNMSVFPRSAKYPDYYEELIKKVTAKNKFDSVYLILHKPDVGEDYDPNYIATYKKIVDAVKDIPAVNIDGCFEDSKKYLKTGYGCSSNINRFQLWPDGSVSGCPYSHRPITKGVDSKLGVTKIVDAVLDNIRAANKIYQFKNCKIPKAIMDTEERVELSRMKSLRILED